GIRDFHVTGVQTCALPILVLDNAEAEQHVGQEVPFRTGEYARVGQVPGAINPFTTIQREDVGTTLTITPQINEGSGMILTIQLRSEERRVGKEGRVRKLRG